MLINRFCPHCGRLIREDALFCLDCGEKVISGQATAQPKLSSDQLISRSDITLSGLPKGAHLLIVNGLDQGKTFSLTKKVVTIGRQEADVFLTDPFVSRRHAQISQKDQQYYIKDLGSANGTLINNQAANGQQLADGDVIEVGYTTLVFRCKL